MIMIQYPSSGKGLTPLTLEISDIRVWFGFWTFWDFFNKILSTRVQFQWRRKTAFHSIPPFSCYILYCSGIWITCRMRISSYTYVLCDLYDIQKIGAGLRLNPHIPQMKMKWHEFLRTVALHCCGLKKVEKCSWRLVQKSVQWVSAMPCQCVV